MAQSKQKSRHTQKGRANMPKSRRSLPYWIGGVVLVALMLIAGAVFLRQAQDRIAGSSVQPAGLPAEISAAQAAQKRDQGAFILDVREPDEWQQFHIPGATLIPLGSLQSRLNEVPRDQEVVVVCRTGHRSAQGRDILLNAGFAQVTSMAGGVTQWQAQGLPTATGN